MRGSSGDPGIPYDHSLPYDLSLPCDPTLLDVTVQYDGDGRAKHVSTVAVLGGDQSEEIVISLNMEAAKGTQPWESAFVSASGSMRFSVVGFAPFLSSFHMTCIPHDMHVSVDFWQTLYRP